MQLNAALNEIGWNLLISITYQISSSAALHASGLLHFFVKGGAQVQM
jgi:hypothetical protein